MQLLKSAMQQDKVEALIISRGSDIKYLTGFTGEYGVAVLLLTADKDYFITDGRFTNQAEQETEGLEVSAFTRGSSYFARTGELVKQCGIKECGIYGEDISFADYQALTKECTGTHFVQNENIWKKVFSCDEKVLIMKIKNIRNIYDCEGI